MPNMEPSSSHRYLLFSLMLAMMLCGWSEGSIGPLIPSILAYYKIDYATASMQTVAGWAGAMMAGFTNIIVSDTLGFELATPLSGLLQAVAYAGLASGWSWSFFLAASSLNGYALTIQDAQVNNMASRLPSAASVFLVQGSFAVGSAIGPFFSTAVAERYPTTAYQFFYIPMGVAIVVSIQLFHACRGIREENMGKPVLPEAEPLVPKADRTESKMKRILQDPAAYAMIFWAMIYCVLEMVVNVYLTSFLIKERGATISAGYATTGFWIAMAISRFGFAPISITMGFGKSIIWYSIIALISVGLVAGIPTQAVAVGGFFIVGLMLGPMYPNAIMVVAEAFDEELRGGIIGLMGCFGGGGAAVGTLLAGAACDHWGLRVLTPILAGTTLLEIACFGVFLAILGRRGVAIA